MSDEKQLPVPGGFIGRLFPSYSHLVSWLEKLPAWLLGTLLLIVSPLLFVDLAAWDFCFVLDEATLVGAVAAILHALKLKASRPSLPPNDGQAT